MDSSDVINRKTLFKHPIALCHINTLLPCVTLLRNNVKKKKIPNFPVSVFS